MKEELERYRMREEELPYLIERKIQEALEEFLSQGELVEENSSYKIIKLYKGSVITEESSSESEMYRKSPSLMNLRVGRQNNDLRRVVSGDLFDKLSEVKEKDKDIAAIEAELAK